MKAVLEKIEQAKLVAAFTGAGISTLCGIPDFRGPQGLYKQPDAERIFDIDWFRRDPSIYYTGCRELIYGLRNRRPGPVHTALARLESAGKLEGIITQNIDMLHQKAGSRTVYEIHGSPWLHHCFECGHEASFETVCHLLETMDVARCPQCGGAYKPDVTFFGEALPEVAFDRAMALAENCDLMLVLGSSLTVYPAATIPHHAAQRGCDIVIVNAQPTALDAYATACYSDLQAFADVLIAAFPDVEPNKNT